MAVFSTLGAPAGALAVRAKLERESEEASPWAWRKLADRSCSVQGAGSAGGLGLESLSNTGKGLRIC